MKKIIIILLFLILARSVLAQTIYGQDLLALQQKNFNSVNAGKAIVDGQAIGSLDHTFGDDLTSVKNILQNVKPKYYRVHFINGPCIRNRNCGKYEYVSQYSKDSFQSAVLKKDNNILNSLKNRVKLYCDLKKQYTDTIFLFSPVLEHNLNVDAWKILADATLDVCPATQLVNSPMGPETAKPYRGAWIERHGTKLRGDIVSTDGEEITDTNIDNYKKNNRKAKIVFSWSRVYNCRTNSATFVDPRNRTACPDMPQFQMLSHIFDDRQIAPKFAGKNCSKIKKFDSPWINKPLAEDTGTGDQRANYPVIIIGDKSSVLNVLDYKGNSIGTVGYYGTYDPLHGHRYYSKWRGGSRLSGYQYESKVRESSGNPNAWLKVGNVCYGPVILGRRAGSFR